MAMLAPAPEPYTERSRQNAVNDTSAPTSAVVTSMMDDLRQLATQYVRLARLEVSEELKTALTATIKGLIASGLMAVGALVLAWGLALLLADMTPLPRWAAFCLVGLAVGVGGYAVLPGGKKDEPHKAT